MEDWRLELSGHKIENLSGTTFYKVTFPDFWKKAYQEKNAFYQLIEHGARLWVESTNKGHEDLEGEKIQHFWHDHCDLCWEKVMTDIECTFYVTDDFRHWICEECFNDFKEQFDWKEVTDFKVGKIIAKQQFFIKR